MRPIKSLSVFLLCWLVAFTSTGFVGAQASQTTIEKLAALGGYACPNSRFTCVKVKVPLDHGTLDDKRTIDVVFSVLPATGERKGMFVTATGGPGTSGLEMADSYAATIDPAITEHYDLVFFDQRGAKQSGNLACPDALDHYQIIYGIRTNEQFAARQASAKTFADNCVAELAKSGVPEDTLKLYGTTQAVEDLDTFRLLIGDNQIWLYGESYGTVYAQAYATAHPSHVAALFLDGAVDVSTPTLQFLQEQTQAFNDVLVATLQDCNRNTDCASEFGGDAVAFYDSLASELGRKGIDFKFPIASGRQADRTFTLDMLESVATDALYTEEGRMLFQRALAAAAQRDLVPLAKLYYASQNQPATSGHFSLGGATDRTLYFVVSCADNQIGEGTAEAQATAYAQAGTAIAMSAPRLVSNFFGLLPCIYWPAQPTAPSKPLAAEGIPTFVLGATADPATPAQEGERIYSHLSDGYLITTEGGAHVIFNRNNACPDSLISQFLLDGTKPSERETRCEGVIAVPFVPNPPSSVRAIDTPLDMMKSVYDEVYYLPEYYYWDGNGLVLSACTAGGVIGIAQSSDGDQIQMSDCAFFGGFAMTGSGVINDDTFTLKVQISGFENGSLTFTKDATGNIKLSGEYAGLQVDLSDTLTSTAA